MDQKFNLLVGRELQKDYGQKPQIVATVPLLVGTDGVDKMSKSKNNYVGIAEPPKVMFRKVMGVSDDLMWRYFELLTDTALPDIAAMRDSNRPMDSKMDLAARIVRDFHGDSEARQAADDFTREVRQGAIPEDVETVALPEGARAPAGVHVAKMAVAAGLATSRTDAERLLKQGAIEIDGVVTKDLVHGCAATTLTVRVGKKWKKVRVG